MTQIKFSILHATVYGMRTRISTTVDAKQLMFARKRFGQRDAEMFDAALAALMERMDRESERLALELQPYDIDPQLSMQLAPGVSEGYDGVVPNQVLLEADKRRARRVVGAAPVTP